MKRPLRVLITAGPTREPIDPVRFISNYSTGYMGARLAAESLQRGHRVTVVRGPGGEPMPPGAIVLQVEEAWEMEEAVRREAKRADLILMAAAVSDFRPRRVAQAKLRRRGALTIKLEASPDIIGRLPRREGQLIVGFALETGRVVARARRKLLSKRLDLLLAQHVQPRRRAVLGKRWRPERANGEPSPFGRRKVRAWLLARGGPATSLGRVSKPEVARLLLDKIEALWYGQRGSAKAP